MLITAAALGCLSPALTIAAGMAYKDPFVLPIDKKGEADAVRRQGLTLVHFSPQPEPVLTQNTP